VIINLPESVRNDFVTVPLVVCPACSASYVASADDATTDVVCPTCGARGTFTASSALAFRGDGERAAAHLDQTVLSGKQLARVVSNLLDVSMLEAGRLALHPAPVDLAALLTALAADFGPRAAEAGVALEVRAPPLTIPGDVDRLQQVLENLVENAIKFSARGGAVSVTATLEGDEVAIAVRDTGIGIDSLHHEAVFESFRQLDGGHTRRAGGTGLGLTISKRLVELHGGSLTVESALGSGSTFTARLPRGR
jgi:signal transduction histidine kinase